MVVSLQVIYVEAKVVPQLLTTQMDKYHVHTRHQLQLEREMVLEQTVIQMGVLEPTRLLPSNMFN